MESTFADKQTQEREVPLEDALPNSVRLHSWAWLLVAGVLLLFANGANTLPLAAWLAPVFLLRFLRIQRVLVGLPAVYGLLIATFAFQFRGMVPIPGLGYDIFLAAFGVLLLLPYLVDRLIAPRLKGFAAALIFPTAWVATEFLSSLGPYGSWCSIAYSQYGNLPLLQILSVTGLWGITFLIGWFAATVNWVWENGLDSRFPLRGIAVFAATLVTVMLLGGARLAFNPPSSPTVRVASISRAKIQPEPSDTLWQHVLADKATNIELTKFSTWEDGVNSDLLSRAGREAQAGAKIVFWGEANALTFKETEPALIARGRELAARYQIYLAMALGVWSRGKNPPFENKLVMIQPNGQVAWEYNKVRPVPGPEAASQVRGDGKLRSLDTPYGKLTSVICFDADFPRLLAQAGAMGADLVVDPSNDWRAIDPWHTQMASYRAIEQGTNLIRHTSQGLSAAYDYEGHQLAAMDHYVAVDHTLISQAPTKGVWTIYSRLGDWFAWLCMAGMIGLAAFSLRRRSPAV